MTEKLKGLLGLLEERLVEHDESRKEVQNKLKGTCSKIKEDADSLKEKINEEISEDFNAKEEETFGLIEKLNEGEGRDVMNALIEEGKEELSKVWKYTIQNPESAQSFVDSSELKISSVKIENNFDSDNAEYIANKLQEHINKLQESKDVTQEEFAELCNKRRKETEELETRINEKLEEVFNAEDARIQGVVKMIKVNIDSEDPEEVKKLIRKAQLTLLKIQKYSLDKRGMCDEYDLKVEREASLKFIDFEERKSTDLVPSFTEKGELSLSFAFFSEDEVEVLKGVDSPFEVEVTLWEKDKEDGTSKTFTKKIFLGEPVCFRSTFTARTAYCLRMKIAHQGMSTQWSDEAKFTTPDFKECCIWNECADDVYENRKYFVDEENPRIATKIGYGDCTVIGNITLPLDQVTSWSIKILESKRNDRNGIYIGVAPSDINQNEDENYYKCGWYFHCYNSLLCSGPPHGYDGKEYGPRKEYGEYVHTGGTAGVVMDTAKGDLSFVVNGVNLGVAFEGIPLDKPLVPCVILHYDEDSVELDATEVKENVDSSIPAPSNIKTKSATWDSVTLTWDGVKGASFYQVEADGSKLWDVSTINTFRKRGLLSDTEHTFRVRAVKRNLVSEWSDAVKGMTQKAAEFSECMWKKCPSYVDMNRKYSVYKKNPQIATKKGSGLCTTIGNTPLPPNNVTSWSIKILKSEKNDGNGIHVGVAPFDINQNERRNFEKCGWYFSCYSSSLISGPPHKTYWEEYGPRKEKYGQYIHTGDTIGVVMDTAKGDLSFALNGVNLGDAYEKIPLDIPLVPCVLLGGYRYDSVELII